MNKNTQNTELFEALKKELAKNKQLSNDSVSKVKLLSDEQQALLKSFALETLEAAKSQNFESEFNRIYKTLVDVQKDTIANRPTAEELMSTEDDYSINEILVRAIHDSNIDEATKDEFRVKLITKNAALIGKVVQKYAKLDDGKISNDDLLQECQIAFLRAIDTFNPELGNKFSTYVTTCMKNALCGIFVHKINKTREKEFSLNNKVSNSKSAEPTELIEFIAESDSTPEEVASMQSTNEILYNAINKLQPDRKFIAYVRYELCGVKKTSQFEIADFTGATQTNISKIESAMKTDLEAFLSMANFTEVDL